MKKRTAHPTHELCQKCATEAPPQRPRAPPSSPDVGNVVRLPVIGRDYWQPRGSSGVGAAGASIVRSKFGSESMSEMPAGRRRRRRIDAAAMMVARVVAAAAW